MRPAAGHNRKVDISRTDYHRLPRGLPGCIAYLEGTPPFQDRHAHPPPDLVILDLIMPDIDGFGVLGWLQRRWGPRHVPVIVLTSSDNPDDERRALALGAAQFLRKPADLDNLANVVEGIVNEYLGRRSVSA